MWGAVVVAAAEQRRREIERKRARWTETREERGEQIEYLMVNCECCGQPFARQKVIRFNEREFTEWQKIRGAFWTTGDKFLQLLIFPATIVPWIFVSWKIPELFGWSIAMLLVAAIMYLGALEYFGWKRRKKLRARQRDILASHNNIPAQKIGMLDQYPTEYVIVPEWAGMAMGTKKVGGRNEN